MQSITTLLPHQLVPVSLPLFLSPLATPLDVPEPSAAAWKAHLPSPSLHRFVPAVLYPYA